MSVPAQNLIAVLMQMLEGLKSWRSKRKDEYDAALHALYAAITETQLYIAQTERTKERDFQLEGTLARLWARAAVPVRRIDDGFAERCLLKNLYWTDPNNWTQSEITSAKIDIDRVAEYARQLVLENP